MAAPAAGAGVGMDEEIESLSLEELPKSATRLFAEALLIAACFATLTIAIGVAGILFTGGLFEPATQRYLEGLIGWDRVSQLGWFTLVLATIWTGWFWYLFKSVREFRSLPPEEWKSRPDDLVRLFRQVHDIPYLGTLVSVFLWVAGGIVAIWFFRDLSSSFYWVIPTLSTCTAMSINLPQIYAQRDLLRPLENEIRVLNPAINVSNVKRRNSIGRKLRSGLFGLLLFTLGVGFLVSFVVVERFRVQDRVERLDSLLPLFADWVQRAQPSDFSPSERERWTGPLGRFHTGSRAGPVLYDLTDGIFLVNVPGVAEDSATVEIMQRAQEQYEEDYRHGVTFHSLPESIFDEFGLQHRYLLALAELHTHSSTDLFRSLIVIYALIAVLCLLVSVFLSRDLIVPLRSLLKYTRRVGQGRLIRHRPFVTGDELGELAEQTAQTVSNLADIVTDIREASTALGEAARAVATRSVTLSEASRGQYDLADNTARSVDQLAARLESGKQEIDRLEEAVEGSSSAAIELHATAQQVNTSTGELAAETGDIRKASGEMLASTERLASRLSDLESFTAQTVSAVQLIEDRVNALRTDAVMSEQLSSDVLANTQSGRDALAQTVRAITESRQLVDETAGIVVSLRSRNRAINEIIETIRSVASRTTLLSLNASILAAQAGEHGASFQVVAEEIRQLAYGTTGKAREIAELIETIQVETERAANSIEEVMVRAGQNVAMAESTSRVLDEITQKAEESLSVVERTRRAVDDQSQSARSITQVVNQLGELVREFSRLGETQRYTGTQIATRIEQVQQQVARVNRASHEQVRASAQVTEGVETVNHTLQSVLRTLNEEIGASGDIRRSAATVRETASRSREQTDELVRVARELETLASRLDSDVGRFRLED